MHLIISHKKVAILCGFSMYSFGGCCSSSVKLGYERKTEDYWRQNFSGKVFEMECGV